MRRSVVPVLVLAVLLVRVPAEARGGDLDPRFGRGGRSALADLGGFEQASALAVQRDGAIVVVGTTGSTDRLGRRQLDLAMARYRSDGSLDRTFSSDGKAKFDLGGTDQPQAVAVTPSGSIIVTATRTHASGSSDLVVVRLRGNGALDPSFGVGGVRVLDIGLPGASAEAAGVVVQPDGNIVVGGTVTEHVVVPDRVNSTIGQFLLARLDRSGALDPTFGTAGLTILPVDGALDRMVALLRRADGSLVAVGNSSGGSTRGILLARFMPSGQLDPTFGTLGTVKTVEQTGGILGYGWLEAAAAAFDEHGRILVAGAHYFAFLTVDRSLLVARYLADGKLDPSFGSKGISQPYHKQADATSISVRPGGKLVTAATQGSCALFSCDFRPLVLGLTGTGALDGGFGSGGAATMPAGIGGVAAITLQAGRPVVAGYVETTADCYFCFFGPDTVTTNEDLALVRYAS